MNPIISHYIPHYPALSHIEHGIRPKFHFNLIFPTKNLIFFSDKMTRARARHLIEIAKTWRDCH